MGAPKGYTEGYTLCGRVRWRITVVDGKIILELKAVKEINKIHEA